jgi:long-chain acyl-CoA synthetase
VDRVNRKLSTTERIRNTKVVDAFTVENGMLTPTMKVKRRIVLAEHAEAVEAMHRR